LSKPVQILSVRRITKLWLPSNSKMCRGCHRLLQILERVLLVNDVRPKKRQGFLCGNCLQDVPIRCEICHCHTDTGKVSRSMLVTNCVMGHDDHVTCSACWNAGALDKTGPAYECPRIKETFGVIEHGSVERARLVERTECQKEAMEKEIRDELRMLGVDIRETA